MTPLCGQRVCPRLVLRLSCLRRLYSLICFFFFNDTATTEIYTLSLHDALPISDIGWITGHSYIVYGPLALGATSVMYEGVPLYPDAGRPWRIAEQLGVTIFHTELRSEEHTSELQSLTNLVCRLLHGKKKNTIQE